MAMPIYFVSENDFADENVGPESFFADWMLIFKMRYLLYDLLIFMILLHLFFKPSDFLKTDLLGLSIYTFCGIFMFNFLYERQDFWLGGLIFFAVALLLSRWHWTLSFVLLAIGIHFKLIPLIIVPLFLVGSLPSEHYKNLYQDFFDKKFIWVIAKRVLFLFAVNAIILIPFYISGGMEVFNFLSFHGRRGLQLESTYSSLLMVLSFLGLPVKVTHEFGAFNLDAPGAVFLAKVSSTLVLGAIVMIIFFFLRAIKKHFVLAEENESRMEKELTIAQSIPQSFLCILLAILIAGISLAKVFSPQYLLWIIPAMALLSFRKRTFLAAGLLFMAACLLTAAIFPYLYFTDFVHAQEKFSDGSIVWAAPTFLATIILFARNTLLIISATILAFSARQ